MLNSAKKSPKACVVSFPASRLGMYLKEALPQFKLPEAAALPEWISSLQAGNQSEQGLYLFLVPFVSVLLFSILQQYS
ncbi:hypothetical protein A6V25_15230 [Nostoc sp. ATCC 53789]|nr:hypothetical protein A6V25_15230 [Nostoc sp. ATCC 53789]